MIRTFKIFLSTSTLLFACSINAQTNYVDISKGSTIEGSISLGHFSKSIPLPPGSWTVANRVDGTVPLTGGRYKSAPKITLTLINNDGKNEAIAALVVSFTPNSIPIRWNGNTCESANNQAIVFDYGNNSNSLVYFCAKAIQRENFRSQIISANKSENEWIKNNISPLAQKIDDMPDRVIAVDVYGNRHAQKYFYYTFFIKSESSIFDDFDYAEQVKNWVRDSGFVLEKILMNETASFTSPKFISKSQKSVQTSGTNNENNRFHDASISPVRDFLNNSGFAYPTDTDFCDELKWGIQTEQKILALIQNGNPPSESIISTLENKGENILRYEVFGRIAKKLKSYSRVSSVENQCKVSIAQVR